MSDEKPRHVVTLTTGETLSIVGFERPSLVRAHIEQNWADGKYTKTWHGEKLYVNPAAIAYIEEA